jgi:hypothetical protein
MADSASGIASDPQWIDIALAYIDGHLGVEDAQQMEARFPHERYGWCFVDVTGAEPQAQVRDWETGDKGGSLEQWVIDHNKASGRKDAVVYCDRSTIPEVRQLTGSQVLGVDYFLFIASLDGTLFGPAQYPHVVANQVMSSRQTGGSYDLSIVFDASLWLPAAAAPKPPVDPTLLDVYTLAVKMETQIEQILARL